MTCNNCVTKTEAWDALHVVQQSHAAELKKVMEVVEAAKNLKNVRTRTWSATYIEVGKAEYYSLVQAVIALDATTQPLMKHGNIEKLEEPSRDSILDEAAVAAAIPCYETRHMKLGDAVVSNIMDLKDEKRAPVQGYKEGIPWEMHMRAYSVYSKRYGEQKALTEGNCRGGFSTGELDEFIPQWRDELTEIGKLRARLKEITSL